MATPVIFRRYPEGDIIALFPDDVQRNYDVVCYQHIGQHGTADYAGVIAATKPATESEYADLMRELQSLGYSDLKVYRRYSPDYSRAGVR